MTEAEWLAGGELWTMLDLLGPEFSERKSRLFAVLCCRRAWHLIPVEESRRCVDAAEQFADGLIGQEELTAVVTASMQACESEWHRRTETGERWGPVEQAIINAVGRIHRTHGSGRNVACPAVRRAIAIERAVRENQQRDGGDFHYSQPQIDALEREEEVHQASLLREIAGNPFRPITLDSRWQTETVVALATGIYAERAFDRMPILADALEDAGCDLADILTHCRSDGPHVRGCWVVDLILGKS